MTVKFQDVKETIKQKEKGKFEVVIENKVYNIELNEEWNPGFDYTPEEIAFYKALDIHEETSKKQVIQKKSKKNPKGGNNNK